MSRSLCGLVLVALIACPGGVDARTRPAARSGAVRPGDSAVLKAQVLLGRAHFSVGQIDGVAGGSFKRALSGFQKARGLAESGRLDAATMKALEADSAPVLVPYTTTQDDVAGPFEKIPDDMMEKAKLTKLGYASAVEGLGEKFHVNPNLLKKLNPGKNLDQPGVEIQVPNVAKEKLGKAASLTVSKASGTLTALDAEGKVLAQYPATIGSEKDPLPIGDWAVTKVSPNPVFFYDPSLFWNADAGDAKTKIAPGPNNPVGVVWIGLTKEHYGIHGTPEPSTIGHTESHGCIRLTNWDAMEVAGMVGPKTPVRLTE